MQANFSQLVMKVWWWIAVPYTLIMIGFLKVLRPSPGYMAHELYPLTNVFWILLPSSVVWTLVSAWAFFRRSTGRSSIDKTMLALGVIICILTGIEVVAHWPNIL